MRKRVAIITPYYKEPEAMLRRCIASVATQSAPCTHFLVADGFPQAWIDQEPVRHIALPRNHADEGNTPRSTGAVQAAKEGFDAIAFLDADNWYDKHHVKKCLRVAEGKDVDYVIARRRFVREDGSEMQFEEENYLTHVETNCFFLLRGSFYALPRWQAMPKIVAKICDRVFYASLRHDKLKYALCPVPSVNYLATNRIIYEKLGEPVPASAKPPINTRDIFEWWGTLTRDQRNEVDRAVGFPLDTILSREPDYAIARHKWVTLNQTPSEVPPSAAQPES